MRRSSAYAPALRGPAVIDVMIVRIALVLATVFVLGPVAVLTYLLVGWIANEG